MNLKESENIIIISSDEEEIVLSSDEEEEIQNYQPLYLEGTFETTYLSYHKNGVKFEELVNKDHLLKGIFTSFATDMNWLLSKLPEDCQKIIVNSEKGSKGESERIDRNLLFIKPRLNYGSMHSKLMLLYYPTFLRIVIGSANLVDFDWELIENIVFIQDFPLLELSHKNEEDVKTVLENEFIEDLKEFMDLLNIPHVAINTLDLYSFSMVNVSLITSAPYPTKSHQGLYSLSKKLNKYLDFSLVTSGEINYQTSSLGRLDKNIINGFCSKLYPPHADLDFKVIFPSHETVSTSLLGTEGGGTIFFNCRSYGDTKNTLKKYLYDSISLRHGSLSHCKTIFGTLDRPSSIPEEIEGDQKNKNKSSWFYCGSHNFSTAAWGNMISFLKRESTLNKTNNYELGVLAVYGGKVKLPPTFKLTYLYPPPAYDRFTEPWIQDTLR